MVSRTMRGPPQKGTQCCPRQRSLVYLRVCVYRHLNLEKVKEKKIWTQNAILFWKNKNMRTCGRPLQFNLVQVRFTRAQLFDAKAAPFFVRTRIYRPFERFIRRPWRLCSWYTTKKNKDKIMLWGGFKTISSGWLISLSSSLKEEVWQKAKRNKRNKRRVRANAYLQLEWGVLCCSFSWCEVIKTFLSFKSDERRILNLNSEVCAQPKTSKFSSMWKP